MGQDQRTTMGQETNVQMGQEANNQKSSSCNQLSLHSLCKLLSALSLPKINWKTGIHVRLLSNSLVETVEIPSILSFKRSSGCRSRLQPSLRLRWNRMGATNKTIFTSSRYPSHQITCRVSWLYQKLQFFPTSTKNTKKAVFIPCLFQPLY